MFGGQRKKGHQPVGGNGFLVIVAERPQEGSIRRASFSW